MMWFVIVLIAIFVIVYVKESLDEKKGVNSEEKRKIEEIVQKVVPDSSQYTVLYAYWYQKRASSTIRSETYWYYAIGFSKECIYIIPLSFADKDIAYGKPIIIQKSNLGVINTVKNDGPINFISFYDEDQNEIISIWVSQSNTKCDKMNPVNIQQKDEAKAFMQTIYQWMDEVNTAHGVEASGKIGKPVKKRK